ncbi:unnamed protein product [Sphagnum balticum]
MPWIAIVSNLSGFVYFGLITWVIVAADTNATLIAWPSLGEALAVELKAVNFSAFAARMAIIMRMLFSDEVIMMVMRMMRVGGLIAILIKELLEEIFAVIVVV